MAYESIFSANAAPNFPPCGHAIGFTNLFRPPPLKMDS